MDGLGWLILVCTIWAACGVINVLLYTLTGGKRDDVGAMVMAWLFGPILLCSLIAGLVIVSLYNFVERLKK